MLHSPPSHSIYFFKRNMKKLLISLTSLLSVAQAMAQEELSVNATDKETSQATSQAMAEEEISEDDTNKETRKNTSAPTEYAEEDTEIDDTVFQVPFENTDQYKFTSASSSGLGSSPELKIVKQLLEDLENDSSKLPGWYITNNATVTTPDSHSLTVSHTNKLREIIVLCTLLPTDALSVNIKYSTTNSALSHALWMYDTSKGTITELGHEQNSLTGDISLEYSLPDGKPINADGCYLFVLWDANMGQSQLVINGVDITFTPDPEGDGYKDFMESVPEPTTATLSLLALTGLAIHRRRK